MLVETEAAQTEFSQEPQAQCNYALSRNFVLRMTGFPTEAMITSASQELSQAADESFVIGAHTLAAAQALLSSDAPLSRSLRRRLKRGKAVADGTQESAEEEALQGPAREQLEHYKALYTAEQEHNKKTTELYDREYHRALKRLYEFVVSEPFQQILSLSSPELAKFTPKDANPPEVRNSHIRQREFTWISYLQRVTTKNETISFFGPSAWGDFDPQEPAAANIELSQEHVAEREVYVERWVCEGLAGLISADTEAHELLPVQLADDLIIRGEEAVFLAAGKSAPLSPEECAIALACEIKPYIGPSTPVIESLVERKILVRNLQVPIAAYPFEALQRIIAAWPEHPAKDRWSARLAEIENARLAIERNVDLEGRQASVQRMMRSLQDIGMNGQHNSQSLYASRLPINEDCRRGVKKLMLGQPIIEQLLGDLAPWYELWRDMAGLYTTRLHEKLKEVWLSLGGEPVPLPVFLRACSQRGLPINGTGGTGLLPGLEEEIQVAWQKQLGDRWTQPVLKMTEEDTAFLRSHFQFRRMKAYDNMAPDLQICAPDAESLSKGNWSLLLAEIHPDFTKWQHCFHVWCPDKQGYAADYASQGGHAPAVVFGHYGPFFASAHTTLGIFPYTNDWTFVGVPGPEGAESLRSAETLVDVTEDDVVLTHRGHVLGSMLNTFNTALNTHRLELHGNRSHSPRLQVGRVFTQRETWTLQADDELRQAAEAGGYAAFSAFRKFRQQHALPETTFIRGVLPYRLNFHKDVKPMFMDFRNPLLIEVLSKMTSRFRRIAFSEMLPRLEHCWLEGPGGNYSCEFRTVIMATQESRKAGNPLLGRSPSAISNEKALCATV
jgi:hypothetical protein